MQFSHCILPTHTPTHPPTHTHTHTHTHTPPPARITHTSALLAQHHFLPLQNHADRPCVGNKHIAIAYPITCTRSSAKIDVPQLGIWYVQLWGNRYKQWHPKLLHSQLSSLFKTQAGNASAWEQGGHSSMVRALAAQTRGQISSDY